MTTRRTFLLSSAMGVAALTSPSFIIKAYGGSDTNIDFLPQVSDFLPYATPESQGVSSEAILNFITEANKCNFEWHGFSLIRHGKTIAEGYWSPFKKGGKHTLYSLSKSFTSSAIGMLVDEGKLKVTDKVVDLFPESLPVELSENLKEMTVHHLLSMNTGHGTDTMPVLRNNQGKTWVERFLSHPVVHKPGSHFLYNTGATYMQSAIVQKVTGQKLTEYLKPRLFDPLGITDYDWELSPEGINTGGYGLRVSTEAIAKFGQLYLNEGTWNGKQLISKSWIHEATKIQTTSQDNDSDWGQGYGYQFWRCKPGFYRGDGAYGQYCIVMPQHDAVLAINSESWDMGKSMQIAWDTLLPAFGQAPLQEDVVASKKLKQTLANLKMKTGDSNTELEKKESKINNKYSLSENPFGLGMAAIQCNSTGCILTLDKMKLHFAYGTWKVNGNISYPFITKENNQYGIPFAGNASWLEDGSLELRAKFVEGIHSEVLKITFENDNISIQPMNSVVMSRKQDDGRKAILGTLKA